MDSHRNFAYSTVVTPPAPAISGTSITVFAGEGARFTAPCNATVWPVGELPLSTNAEIVRITLVAGDVLTIVRTQESSGARTIQAGDQIANTITVKIVTDLEDAVSLADTHANTASAAATSVNARVDTVAQAVSVISNQVSALNSSLTSVDAHANAASAAATSVDARVNVVSQAVSVISSLVSVISILASVADAHASVASLAATSADAHASIASVAATSVDGRVNSLHTLTVKSVGGTSVRGLQSVFNALSNRISAGGGTGSVTSQEMSVAVQVASAAATSVDTRVNALSQLHSVLSQQVSALSTQVSVVSIAVGSINTRVNSVNTFISGISARSALSATVSTHGLQSVVDALSNRISLNAKAISDMISAGAGGTSVTSNELSAVSNTASVNNQSIITFLSGISALSIGGVSTHGLQSVVNALSARIAAGGGSVTSAEVQTASAAATSVDARVNALSQLHSVLSQQVSALSTQVSLVSVAVTSVDTRVNAVSQLHSALSQQVSALSSQVSVVSVAVGSVDSRVNSVNTFVSGISSRSVGNVSTHGFQSVINALSGHIDAASAAATSVDTRLNALSQIHSVLSQQVSALSSQVSVVSVAVTSVDTRVNAVSQLVSAISQQVSLLSQQVSALSTQVSVVSIAVGSVNSRVNSVNTFVSGISSRSVGGVSTHGLQSVIDALSNRISAGGGGSVTSTEVSAVSHNASVANQSIVTFLSGISARSALSATVSTHGLQSVVDALSNRISLAAKAISDIISAGGGGTSVTSNELSTLLAAVSAQAASALSDAISAGSATASNLLSHVEAASVAAAAAEVHASAASAAAASVDARLTSVTSMIINASTVGSIAALSIVSVQFGGGQFKVVTGAQAISTGVFTKVSGLSLSLGGSNVYKVDGQINYAPNGTSGTAVFQFGMSATQQPIYAAFRMVGPSAIAAGAPNQQMMFGGESAICLTPSVMYSVKPGVSGNGHMMFFDGIIQCSTAAGVLKVVAAATTVNNGGCTIRVGSFIRAFRIA